MGTLINNQNEGVVFWKRTIEFFMSAEKINVCWSRQKIIHYSKNSLQTVYLNLRFSGHLTIFFDFVFGV